MSRYLDVVLVMRARYDVLEREPFDGSPFARRDEALMNEPFTDDTPEVSTSFVLEYDRRRGRRESLHRVQGLHPTDPRAFASYEKIAPASTHSDFFAYRLEGREGDLFEDQHGRLLELTSRGLFPVTSRGHYRMVIVRALLDLAGIGQQADHPNVPETVNLLLAHHSLCIS